MSQINAGCLLLALSAVAMNLMAATDGVFDDASSGTIRVSMSVLPSIQIPGVENIYLSISNRKVDTSIEQSFCVSGNQFGVYRVTASSLSTDSGTFVLTNQDRDELIYFVGYRGDNKRNEFDSLRPDEPSPTYDVTPLVNGCDKSAAFTITFRSEDLLKVQSGLYTGRLTLTISTL